MSFLLGSGVSVQSGIPTGRQLVWEFKKEIYCRETRTHRDLFSDLSLKTIKKNFNHILIVREIIPNCMILKSIRLILKDVTQMREIENYLSRILLRTRNHHWG